MQQQPFFWTQIFLVPFSCYLLVIVIFGGLYFDFKKVQRVLGRCGYIMRCGPIMRRFGLSCIHLVYFLRKSKEFHDMRTECQRIPIHFLLLITHKLLGIAKRCSLPNSLPDIRSPIAVATQLMVYIKRR